MSAVALLLLQLGHAQSTLYVKYNYALKVPPHIYITDTIYCAPDPDYIACMHTICNSLSMATHWHGLNAAPNNQATRSLLNQAAVAMSQNQNKREREAERYMYMYVFAMCIFFLATCCQRCDVIWKNKPSLTPSNKNNKFGANKSVEGQRQRRKKKLLLSRAQQHAYTCIHASAVPCLCSIFSSTSCPTLATCCPHAIISQMSESAQTCCCSLSLAYAPALSQFVCLSACLSLSHSLSCWACKHVCLYFCFCFCVSSWPAYTIYN